MSTKKKVGLAGVMGMQSKPVRTTPQASHLDQKNESKDTPKNTPKNTTPKAKAVRKRALPKSKDQTFKLTGVYLRKTTVGQVKAKLELREEDMSELVEELLAKWLKTV